MRAIQELNFDLSGRKKSRKHEIPVPVPSVHPSRTSEEDASPVEGKQKEGTTLCRVVGHVSR